MKRQRLKIYSCLLNSKKLDDKINIFMKIRGTGRNLIIDKLKKKKYSKNAYFIKYLDLIKK